MPDWLLRMETLAIVPLLLAVLVFLFVRRRADIRIHVRGEKVQVVGKLPPNRRMMLRDFFLNDFPRYPRLTVLLTRRRRERTWKVIVRPNVSPGETQQLRNFLHANW